MTTQQKDALERANGLRAKRASLKGRMKKGREDVRALLLDPPPHLEGMRVEEFLLAVPKVGTVKAGRILRDAKVRPTDKLGKINLTKRCFLYTSLPR